MRNVAPTRLGPAMSQNIWSPLSTKPAAASRGTTMLHTAQTPKPRNSAKIDRPRFRLAIDLPTDAHWPASSGFQPSIQRPGRVVIGASVDSVLSVGADAVVVSPASAVAGGVALVTSGRDGVGYVPNAREVMFRSDCVPGCARGTFLAPAPGGACEV